MTKTKIAFMHIPKTAGFSVLNAFIRLLGAERCKTFSASIKDSDFDNADFVSGHVYFCDITKNAYRFTFLRDPYEQLISHLRWIDHYNMPEYASERDLLPVDIQQEIRRLPVDRFDASSISDFLTKLPRTSPLRISNLQAEMLAFGRNDVRDLSSENLAALAIEHSSQLDYVGLTETIDRDVANVWSELGMPAEPQVAHVNSGPSLKRINIKDQELRTALQPFVRADIFVYEHVRGKFAQDA